MKCNGTGPLDNCKKILSILLLLTIVAGTALAEGENYCHDESTWYDWEQKLAKYPGDLGFRILYALRIGLCNLVERQHVTVSEARIIFCNSPPGPDRQTKKGGEPKQ
ncbi:MAG: hypothetical protein J7L69_07920 [Desulfobulbaceae bacterium]|nr:hypothetical protein [Desulfobulbaceae bacterium]